MSVGICINADGGRERERENVCIFKNVVQKELPAG
jgi:hypothetical protein